MDFMQSSQLASWQRAPDYEHTKETQVVIKFCVEFLLDSHSKCGLGEQRRAFVTAAHYLHRLATRVNLAQCTEPKLVALVLLFIAGKVEELRWPLRHGCLQNRGFQAEHMLPLLSEQVTLDRFIELESDLLDILDFELIVHQTVPRPASGSSEEQKETWLLACNAECIKLSPEQFGLLIASTL